MIRIDSFYAARWTGAAVQILAVDDYGRVTDEAVATTTIKGAPALCAALRALPGVTPSGLASVIERAVLHAVAHSLAPTL